MKEAAIRNENRHIYGVQFHPEVTHTPLGKNIFQNYKEYTNTNGLNAFGVFVEKPFNRSNHENVPNFYKWYSGELLNLYHDWKFEMNEEIICDCKSKHLPHPHAISTIIARKQV